jgi:hypothetical protein
MTLIAALLGGAAGGIGTALVEALSRRSRIAMRNRHARAPKKVAPPKQPAPFHSNRMRRGIGLGIAVGILVGILLGVLIF